MINELTNERIVNSLNTNSLNIKQNTMTQQPLFFGTDCCESKMEKIDNNE